MEFTARLRHLQASAQKVRLVADLIRGKDAQDAVNILQLTKKGRALYEELFPQLLRREDEILACLSAQERKQLSMLLGKIEQSLDLIQTSEEADAKQAY